MLQRKQLAGFAVRLMICFAAVAAAYFAAITALPQPEPGSARHEKLAALRSAVAESYFKGQAIANFRQSNALAADTLNRQVKELENGSASLEKALRAGSAVVPANTSKDIEALQQLQAQAARQYRQASAAFMKVIGYSPETDLGSLDLQRDAAEAAARAAAAQRGLLALAQNTATLADSGNLSVQADGPPPLVEAATKQQLEAAAGCFQQLAQQLQAQAFPAAEASRQQCIKQYPAVRQAAVRNILNVSFNDTYAQQTKRLVPGILKQLDQAVQAARP